MNEVDCDERSILFVEEPADPVLECIGDWLKLLFGHRERVADYDRPAG